MNLNTRKLLPLCVPLCAALLAGPVQAYSFQMDSFAVWKNFNPAGLTTPTGLLTTPPIFYDNFADLNAPSSAPNFTALGGGGATSYGMFGSVGPESVIGGQGILTLNSADAIPNTFGTLVQQALLRTSVDPSSPLGLKQDSTNFTVGGIFNLINPGNGIGSYGVRFVDTPVSFGGGTVGNGNDFVSLSVHGRTDGGAEIRFSSLDYTTGIRTNISRQVLDTSHQQIGLGLAYIDPDGAGSAPKAVYASYFYLDNDVPTPFFNMAGSAELFHGENFTLAALYAAATNPVPEPAEYALMLVGLGLVGWAARRKRN